MFVKGGDLFQAIYCLVVCHRSCAPIVIKSYNTFGFAFHLLVLGFGGIELDLIIRRVKFGEELTYLDRLPVLHINLANGSTYSESKAYILGCFYFAGILKKGLASFCADGIYFYCFYLTPFLILLTRSERKEVK